MERMVHNRRTVNHIVGRERERAVLFEMLDEGGPLVAFVHGPAGMGKSSLLDTFVVEARSGGTNFVRLDCRAFEPTEHGFLDAVSDALRSRVRDVVAAASALENLGSVVVLVIDTYEVFRISDTWLRAVFVPVLGERVRVVIAGREPPLAAWFDARGAPDAFRSVLLGPLDDADALAVLGRAGIPEPDARAVNRVARGHPLALQVAAAALRERPGLRVEEAAIPRVVEELTRLYLDHLDAPTRRTLNAAAVVRRATAPLLAAMIPDVTVPDALERLASLPFVDESADGLRVHESVQAAVATRLRARDPETHRRYRGAAWRALQREVGEATRSELWRYTADMLYLLENPAVREAFFPTTAHLYAVEPSQSEDGAPILEIVERHEPPEAAAVLAEWWKARPSAFRVVRDRAGAVVGLVIVIEADAVPYNLVQVDPVVAAWREHLHHHPLPRGQRALFDRCELSREHGDAPSLVQAATWLDIKRIYMEMRPHIGRLYSVTSDPAPYLEALTTLGFSFFPAPVLLGRDYTCAWLDFGPDSVDGWLARLAAAELGILPHELLDIENREVVLADRRVALTPLEFGVLERLIAHKGRAVSRATLIEEVWGHAYVGGSNVVDVVVRSLRKKLGEQAAAVATVRGVGYRFSNDGARR